MPGKKDKAEDSAPEAEASPPQEKKQQKKGEKKPKTGAPEGKPAVFVPENPNFRHIVRFANTDLDGKRPLIMALTDVRGVGRRVAETITHMGSLDPVKRIGDYTEAETESIENLLYAFGQKAPSWMVNHPMDRNLGENRHIVAGDLETIVRDDVNQMRMIRSYRGIRHERGQKVRGQRTKSNGRTGMAAGVTKKSLQEAAKAKKAEGDSDKKK